MLERTAHLTVTLAVGTDPISGTVAIDAEPERPFCGWLELMPLLESARNHSEQAEGNDSPAGDEP